MPRISISPEYSTDHRQVPNLQVPWMDPEGFITPSEDLGKDGMPVYFRVVLGDELFAYLCCEDNGWTDRDETGKTRSLVNAIENYVTEYYAGIKL
jgi:hypothetical protein